MMPVKNFDVVIVGAGPGGYVAAIKGAQLGLRVALVERDQLGGVCLNWGCIPTKALLQSSEFYHRMNRAEEFGLSASELGFDLNKIVKRSRDVARQLNEGVDYLLKKNKVTVIFGNAKLSGRGGVLVSKEGAPVENLVAPHVILATGARARQLHGIEPDGENIWSYREALIPSGMPESLLIIGSGAIGIEFASFYNAMGATVTVVELQPRILPLEDEEISSFVQKEFEQQGMRFLTGASITSVDKAQKKVIATISMDGDSTEITVDKAISAVGVVPNTEGLGLEKAGVALNKHGFIATGDFGETSSKGIYAIGDVAGPPCLAHKASHEGVLCIEKIAGKNRVEPLDVNKIPNCTYSTPQIASIGITQTQAEAEGYEVNVGRFPYSGNGKAIALGEARGLVKTIFDARTGELLGAHLAGAEATELINGFGISSRLEATEEDLAEVIFAHPTLFEMLQESVFDAYGQAIHI